MNLNRPRRCALFAILAGAVQVSMGEPVGRRDVWALIAAMRSVPIDERAVGHLFGGRIDTRTDNGYWTYHEGKGQTLRDGVSITTFGYMTKNDGTAAPGVYMDVSGRCVTIDELGKAYPDALSHRSPLSAHSDLTGYATTNAAGKLSFAFSMDESLDPRCLVNVGFTPKATFSNSPPSSPPAP